LDAVPPSQGGADLATELAPNPRKGGQQLRALIIPYHRGRVYTENANSGKVMDVVFIGEKNPSPRLRRETGP